MDTVIRQISQIETAAVSIIDDANTCKKAFSQRMAEKTEAFDRELEAATEQKIAVLRTAMEIKMNSRLSEQKARAEALLAQMKKNYEDHHWDYVKQLFQSLIKE